VKYLHLRMAKHIDKPVRVQFADNLREIKPKTDKFDNIVYESEAVLLSDSYWTAGSKNTEPIEIALGEHFTFVMSETLYYKFVEQSTDNPLEAFEVTMTQNEGRVMYLINKQIDAQAPSEGSAEIGSKVGKNTHLTSSMPGNGVRAVTTQERIAYGQSFNIAVTTVNDMYESVRGGKVIPDLTEWSEKVEAIAWLIYPLLMKDPPVLKDKSALGDDKDDLPF